MAQDDFKTAFTLFVMASLLLIFFVNIKKQHKEFSIGHDFIIYHANWTQSPSELHRVKELQQAYKLTGIKSLDISLAMSNLNLNQLKTVLPYRFQQYKTLKINVGNNPIGNQGIQYILSLIPNGVQNLQLYFDSIDTQHSLGQVIARQLNNLNSLKTLKFSLILSAKNDIIVQDYLRYVRLDQRLQSYSLVLIGNGLNHTSLTYLKNHLQRANKLKSLQLNLYANKIGIEGANILAQAVQTQKHLADLNIDLYFNNITQIGAQKLAKSIQGINSPILTSFGLNLDFNYIKNEGAKAVGNLLSKMTQLQSLNLGVASKNFGYLGFKHIINGLSHLTNLQQLNFRAGVNRCGYQGAEITKSMLKQLIKLQKLSVNFYENYIGDEGLINISQAAASLKNLKQLYLNFGFNDAKGYGLIKTLKNLQDIKLNRLILSFSSNQFRDSQVNLVKDQLVKIIKNTKQLEFQFMETAISKQKAKELQNLFKSTREKAGTQAKIHVNSVITQDQQQKYKQQQKKREEDLIKIDEEKKKKEKEQRLQTKAEEVEEL